MIRNRFFRGFRTLCMAALALCCAGFAASAQSRDKVVVASKIDTEGALLGHMILIVLEKAGRSGREPASARADQGGAHGAPLRRDRHLSGIHRQRRLLPRHGERPGLEGGAHPAYELVKRLDGEENKLVWLDRAPANNTWLIAVRGDLARREKLATMEDFAQLRTPGGPQARRLGRVRRERRRRCRPSSGATTSSCPAIRSSSCPAATPP